MKFYDFSNSKINDKYYGGSEKKIGIFLDDMPYMLKFQKKTPFGERFNTISEYLGSHIYQMLGFDCQDTYLGKYNGDNVVACRDFVSNGYQFVAFNDVGESTIEDREIYQYSYDDIIKMLMYNKKLTNVEETITTFFDIYIVDALLGNFDRHGGNWGFLKKDGKYTLCPVFDNGSCLYPNMIDEDQMKMVIDNEEEIERRVYSFPTSQIKLNGNKSSYFEVISSLEYKEINNSLKRIYPRIKINEIYSLIDDIDILSDIHKEFYKTMIKNRYERIIKFSYRKLTGE